MAVNAIHGMGPKVVLVTSYRDDRMAEEKTISMLASDKSGLYRVCTPELPLGRGIAGTGDLTAAVFLSRYLETGNLKKTLELTAASVYGILEASFLERESTRVAIDNSYLELLIIRAQNELTSPAHFFEAVKINP